MSTEEHRFEHNPDDDSDREHFNEREFLEFEGWRPLDNVISSIDLKDLTDWINSTIEGEENKIVTLARTKEFSRDGVQAWFIHTGKPQEEIKDAADVIATFYFEDGVWHLEESSVYRA
jgi:hypothetical protein